MLFCCRLPLSALQYSVRRPVPDVQRLATELPHAIASSHTRIWTGYPVRVGGGGGGASQTSEARRHIKIEHFVAIAGAYHPQLYSEAAPRFRESSTCILVQHYQKDKLCLWEPVRAVWERMRDRHASNVYINDLDFSSSPLINANYHDTEKFLLTQKD